MIERYTREEMGKLWSPEQRFQTWLEVELAALKIFAQEGMIPQADYELIRQKARFEVKRIDEIEREVKHDVLAFLTNVAEYLGPEGRHLHYGMTSSDVLDTAFALLLVRAIDQIQKGIDTLCASLQKQAYAHKDTVQIGRSHGIHAEPITFGLKLALYFEELQRNKIRLKAAREVIAVGKLSGAVGTYAHLPPSIERQVLELLNLQPEPVATQVVQRDRHAEVFTAIAILGGTLEKMAVEIRHLQRTEVREAEEPFTKGQKGSSAMPHKRNPIISENITGCARLLRSYAQASLENIALWHERDISHSSVERVIAPDATILADYMLHRMNNLFKDLVVYPERMQENLESSKGLIYSQALMLKLVEKGIRREEAYVLVQRNAMKTWDEGHDFKHWVTRDDDVKKYIDAKALNEVFDPTRYVKARDEMFKRVFEKGSRS